MILTPDQLRELTKRKRRDAQIRVPPGQEHAWDGTPVVGEEALRKLLSGGEASATVREVEPDWSALR